MIYSFDTGARGLTLPRHYTVTKGSKLTLAPRELIATVPLPHVALQDYAKYGAAPVTALAITVILAQLAGAPNKPTTAPHSPAPSKGATSAQLTGVTTTPDVNSGTQNTTDNPSSTTSKTSQPALIDPVMISPVPPTDITAPGGGSGGDGTTLPVIPPVDIPPVGVGDPGTGMTDPGTGTTDPGTGGTVTTPVAQVGVDVFPPTVTLGLTP